ncbi:MAG: GxxExxY protein [Acidobacteriota bacterium]|nr:MAG: GxxExxY protein [Acidobacteriota bacterium]
MTNLILGDEVYAVIGAAMEVHSELRHGYLEAVYQEAMEIELLNRRIPFESQKSLEIFYKETPLKKSYVPDLICFGEVIVELKTIKEIGNIERAQLLNYLHATKLKVGLLINFAAKGQLDWKKLVL